MDENHDFNHMRAGGMMQRDVNDRPVIYHGEAGKTALSQSHNKKGRKAQRYRDTYTDRSLPAIGT